MLPIHDDQGRDYRQLLEKFLIGSVAFSQLADDYLDDANPGAGLNSPNTQDGSNPYTVLEHAWDEGFGYFGGSRDYAELDLATVVGRVSDRNGDMVVDLRSEYTFAWARNAAVRDLASCDGSKTAFAATLGAAFLEGRDIIAHAGDTLTADERAALIAERNVIVATLEQVIAASAIHYINELRNVDYATPAVLDYFDVATHWSEMKGFLLALQFNPRSPFAHPPSAANADFVTLHRLVGDAPALDAADVPAYLTDLLAARDLLATKYGFAAANVAGSGSCSGF